MIIVPASLRQTANAEAVKWDPDAGGGDTFSVQLSDNAGTSLTHYACNGLIDVDYLPPGQGGQTALQVLDAFYATGFYKGYRIRRATAQDDALLTGDVDYWRGAHLDDDGVPQPAGWQALDTGPIKDLALLESGLTEYVEEAT